MTEVFSQIQEGALDDNAEITECIANGAIAQWAAVILVAAGSGETLPRVGTTTTADDPDSYGVKVGPNKTLVAGDICYICVEGRCKAIINANTAAFDLLGTSTSAGRLTPITALAMPATYGNGSVTQGLLKKQYHAIAKALTADDTAGDIIVVDVKRKTGDVA
jgi:hypothetical protein